MVRFATQLPEFQMQHPGTVSRTTCVDKILLTHWNSDKADIPCADFAVTDLFTYDSAEPQDASDDQDEILVFHLDSMVIYPVREMNSSSIVGKLS